MPRERAVLATRFMNFVPSRKYGSREAETKTKNAYDYNKRIVTESVGLARQLKKIKMAKSKSLTVLTVMSSIFALQACSEGITSAEEILSNLSNQTSSEATDPPEISIGAANPTSTETTIPITPSVVSNYSVDNFSVLPVSSSPSSPDEELEPSMEPVTDTPPETDSEVVTDTPPETDSEVVTDTPPETDSEVVTDIAPETDSEVVTDIAPETKDKEVVSVDYTPILEAPAEGELVPYGSTIQFAWSIPVALFGTVTGFDIAIADASEGVVSYRDNGVSMSSCSDNGLCTHEINSADLPIAEGDNIWSISSIGENVSFNIAEATFTLDKHPEVQVANGLSMLSPAAGYIADSTSVDFAWEDLSKPDAIYQLRVFSDAAKTQLVNGTNGAVFDTNFTGHTSSHTFTNDPSDGGTRYAELYQWSDATYELSSRQEIFFEYTAHTKEAKEATDAPPTSTSADFLEIKAIADARWAASDGWYSNSPMKSDEGYHSVTILMGGAQMYRLTGDTAYLDTAVRIGNNWIDSGTDLNGDGIKDWWGYRSGYGDVWNYDHHEWRAAAGIADVLVEMKRTGYEKNTGDIAKWTNFLKVHSWDKWAYGHSQTSNVGLYVSSRATLNVEYVGRWTMIAIALDQTHSTPGNNEYATFINSTSSTLGRFFSTYMKLYNAGTPNVPNWTDGDFRGENGADTSHVGDIIYPIMRLKQLGYNPSGRIEEFLTAFESHLNSLWFPTSAGFYPYPNGSGKVNEYLLSSSHGYSLSAALSPALRDRWVDMFLNNDPTFTYNNEWRLVWMASGILFALNGGEL